MYTLFQTLLCVAISATYNRVYGVRDFVVPQTMFVFFFFAINVHGNTSYSKNDIPDQTDRIDTLFQTKMAKSIPYFRVQMLKNDTLWCGTFLYSLYMGEGGGGEGTQEEGAKG